MAPPFDCADMLGLNDIIIKYHLTEKDEQFLREQRISTVGYYNYVPVQASPMALQHFSSDGVTIDHLVMLADAYEQKGKRITLGYYTIVLLLLSQHAQETDIPEINEEIKWLSNYAPEDLVSREVIVSLSHKISRARDTA